MDTLVVALGPAFAAGLALQRLLEVIDPVIDRVAGEPRAKKLLLGILAVAVGLALSWGAELRVLDALGNEAPAWVDVAVTSLFVSAGTESFNSILKFLGYAKENKKEAAEAARKAAGDTAAPVHGTVG